MTFLTLEVGQTDARVWGSGRYASIHHPSICYLFTFLSLNFLSVIRLCICVCLRLSSVNHPSLTCLSLIYLCVCPSVCLPVFKSDLSSIISLSLSAFCQAVYLSSVSVPGR